MAAPLAMPGSVMLSAYAVPTGSEPETWRALITPPIDTTYEVIGLAPGASAGLIQEIRRP